MKLGDTRTRLRFAWLPVRSRTENMWIWLQPYYSDEYIGRYLVPEDRCEYMCWKQKDARRLVK